MRYVYETFESVSKLLQGIFESKTRRITGSIFLLLFLLSIVTDSITKDPESGWLYVLSALSGIGSILFIAVNILRFLPEEDPVARRAFCILAILWLIVGSIGVFNFLRFILGFAGW